MAATEPSHPKTLETQAVGKPAPGVHFRSDIEGLRAIAVVAVALWHAEIPGIPGGFAGVDVFFTLSGYLITGILLAEYRSTWNISLVNFYARRARRLLPAAALMLVVTLLLSTLILGPREMIVAAGSGRAAAVYLSNVWFAMADSHYFAQTGTGSPFVHTWSLAVEEQFYLAWPLLVYGCLRVDRSHRTVTAMLMLLTALSFAACLVLTYKSPQNAFYHSPLRAWQFGIGALAVTFLPGRRNSSRLFGASLGWAGLAGILACILGLDHIYYPGWRGLLPALSTALVLTSVPPPILSAAPLQRLGALSYSWYLWHWPMLGFAGALVRPLSVGGKLASLAAALAVAAVTHHFIENPIRFNRFLSVRPGLTLAMAGILTAASFGFASAMRSFSYALARSPGLAPFVVAGNDIAMPAPDCVPEGGSARAITCTVGNPAGTRHVVLFGDSHAMHWFPPIEQAAVALGWKLTTLVRPGCPSTDGRRDHTWVEDTCVDWRAAALSWIARTRPDLVIISNIAPTGGTRGGHVQARSLEIYENALRRTLARLAGSGISVMLIRDSPHEHFDIPSCLARAARTHAFPPEACRLTVPDALHPEFHEADKRAAAGLRNVRIVDFTKQHCREGYCDVQRGDLILYRDHQHFTRRYAATLSGLIAREIGQQVGAESQSLPRD